MYVFFHPSYRTYCGNLDAEALSLEWSSISTGCLESLVYYKSRAMLLQEDKQPKESLRNDCLQYLNKLKEVDKLRLHRYEDLAKTSL